MGGRRRGDQGSDGCRGHASNDAGAAVAATAPAHTHTLHTCRCWWRSAAPLSLSSTSRPLRPTRACRWAPAQAEPGCALLWAGGCCTWVRRLVCCRCHPHAPPCPRTRPARAGARARARQVPRLPGLGRLGLWRAGACGPRRGPFHLGEGLGAGHCWRLAQRDPLAASDGPPRARTGGCGSMSGAPCSCHRPWLTPCLPPGPAPAAGGHQGGPVGPVLDARPVHVCQVAAPHRGGLPQGGRDAGGDAAAAGWQCPAARGRRHPGRGPAVTGNCSPPL